MDIKETAPATKTPSIPGPVPKTEQINVLVVGETQQGKSTLIKHTHTYANSTDLDIEIGFGNRSCTKVAQIYSVDAKLRSYHLEDHKSNIIPITKDSYSKLCSFGTEDAKVVLNPLEPDSAPSTINFNFLDTPGLNDSDGNDMDIMAGILAKVNELSHINAIVYVRNATRHFGDSFKTFFNYLQRSMPHLAHGLIIVHSSYTAMRVNLQLRSGKDWAAIRREGFKAATNLDLTHFFVDNEPDGDSPLSVVLSLNEICALLSHIKEQPAQETSSFKLLKTPRMQQVDGYIKIAISEMQRILKTNISELSAKLGTTERQALDNETAYMRAQKKLENIDEDLEAYEHGPDIVLGSCSVSDEYSLFSNLLMKFQFNLPGRTLNFDADYPIGYVRKSASGGSRWASETLQGAHWTGVLEAGIFECIRGSATFYISSAAKNRDKIRLLKKQRDDMEEKRDALEGQRAVAASVSTDIQRLQTILEQSDDLEVVIKRDIIDMKFYPPLRQIYKTTEPKLSRGEIYTFLQVYSPTLADFYDRHL